jgi:hypothetical protein
MFRFAQEQASKKYSTEIVFLVDMVFTNYKTLFCIMDDYNFSKYFNGTKEDLLRQGVEYSNYILPVKPNRKLPGQNYVAIKFENENQLLQLVDENLRYKYKKAQVKGNVKIIHYTGYPTPSQNGFCLKLASDLIVIE